MDNGHFDQFILLIRIIVEREKKSSNLREVTTELSSDRIVPPFKTLRASAFESDSSVVLNYTARHTGAMAGKRSQRRRRLLGE